MVAPPLESVPALDPLGAFLDNVVRAQRVPGPFRIREFCDAPFCTHVGYEEVCSYGHATCFVAKW